MKHKASSICMLLHLVSFSVIKHTDLEAIVQNWWLVLFVCMLTYRGKRDSFGLYKTQILGLYHL